MATYLSSLLTLDCVYPCTLLQASNFAQLTFNGFQSAVFVELWLVFNENTHINIKPIITLCFNVFVFNIFTSTFFFRLSEPNRDACITMRVRSATMGPADWYIAVNKVLLLRFKHRGRRQREDSETRQVACWP